MTYKIAALYRFTPIDDTAAMRGEIVDFCADLDVCGTLLIAPEGVNGTFGGPATNMDKAIDFLDEKLGIKSGELKFSESEKKPFNRFKVRLKKEIITMKAPEADPNKQVGAYVEAGDWNDLIADPETIVIDTRNDYETKVGTFKDAIDPGIESFTQFKDYVSANLDEADRKKKVAMFCTGGIRCEKASSYMMAHGFDEVYHLKGGILKYLETIPADQSLWEGECFIFDQRVAVTHGLEQGSWSICHGCREPLSQEEIKHETYEEGVSCPHCAEGLTPERIKSLRMRHKHYVTQNDT